MDSSLRDSKVNPIGFSDSDKEQLRAESVKMERSDEETLLGPKDDHKKEEIKPKKKRKVQWNDTNGNNLAEIIEFLPSEASDSDNEEPDSCFCTIM